MSSDEAFLAELVETAAAAGLETIFIGNTAGILRSRRVAAAASIQTKGVPR
jgi:isopropylmalate/homocitrate/citramalate synthase